MTRTVLNTKISKVKSKIPDTSSLVTRTVLNTKISEVENKIPNHDKYITTPEYNKLTAESFTAKLKQANLVSNTDFDNKLTSFNKKITSNKIKYLEVQNKLNGLITNDYNLLLGRMYCSSNDGSQNMFVYQSTPDTLELKKDKAVDYVLSWKSKGVCNCELKPLYTTYLHSRKLSEYKMETKFDKDPLAVEQNNYLTKIVINWPKIPLKNFTLKNVLFEASNIIKIVIKISECVVAME